MIGRSHFLLCVFAALVAALIVVPSARGFADDRTVPESREQISLSFAPLVRNAAPAVINIYTRRIVEQRSISPLFNDPFFQRFFGPRFQSDGPTQRVVNALGSGVIVRQTGLAVTNHHVIEGADEITVVLSDRREFDAEVVLSDERTDLAVLQLLGLDDDATLPVLELADNEDLAVGDLVLAIGNPFGVGQTVTSGIVSALARTDVGISDYSFFIQTDAAINPGNSGGALVDMHGRLVGINSAIFSRSGGSLGIGFAIPASMVQVVIAGVEQGGPLVRPWVGASGQTVTSEIAQSMDLDRPGGVLVSRLHPGGPAEQAGLQVGDVIIALDDLPVDDPAGLRFRIATQPLGGEADLTVLRDGEEIVLTIALTAPPEDPPRQTTLLQGRHPFAGAVVANISPALVEELGLRLLDPQGVVVIEVQPRTPARRLRLEPGDVWVAVNGTAISSVEDLLAALEQTGHGWRIAIRRDGRVIETVIYG